VNGFRLKRYNKPLTKEEFTNIVKAQNLDVIEKHKMLPIHPNTEKRKKKKNNKIPR
jgi:hypothetical protein